MTQRTDPGDPSRAMRTPQPVGRSTSTEERDRACATSGGGSPGGNRAFRDCLFDDSGVERDPVSGLLSPPSHYSRAPVCTAPPLRRSATGTISSATQYHYQHPLHLQQALQDPETVAAPAFDLGQEHRASFRQSQPNPEPARSPSRDVSASQSAIGIHGQPSSSAPRRTLSGRAVRTLVRWLRRALPKQVVGPACAELLRVGDGEHRTLLCWQNGVLLCDLVSALSHHCVNTAGVNRTPRVRNNSTTNIWHIVFSRICLLFPESGRIIAQSLGGHARAATTRQYADRE